MQNLRIHPNLNPVHSNLIQSIQISENDSKQISSNKRILQIGISFKENVPDIRNSKAAELAKYFLDNNYKIEVYDPIVDQEDVYNSYNIKLLQPKGKYDSIIIAVPHDFINQKEKLEIFTKKSTMIFDITGKYKDIFADKNIKYWSL